MVPASSDKMVTAFDVEHKVTKKQVKRLRKKICVYDTYQRKKNEKWWDVEVRSTDYDTFNSLSRVGQSAPLRMAVKPLPLPSPFLPLPLPRARVPLT